MCAGSNRSVPTISGTIQPACARAGAEFGAQRRERDSHCDGVLPGSLALSRGGGEKCRADPPASRRRGRTRPDSPSRVQSRSAPRCDTGQCSYIAACPRCGLSPRLRARGSTQAGQLPPGLGLIRHHLENAEVLLGGDGPVPGLGGSARQAEPGLDIPGILAEHAPPLVHRLVVLLGPRVGHGNVWVPA